MFPSPHPRDSAIHFQNHAKKFHLILNDGSTRAKRKEEEEEEEEEDHFSIRLQIWFYHKYISFFWQCCRTPSGAGYCLCWRDTSGWPITCGCSAKDSTSTDSSAPPSPSRRVSSSSTSSDGVRRISRKKNLPRISHGSIPDAILSKKNEMKLSNKVLKIGKAILYDPENEAGKESAE